MTTSMATRLSRRAALLAWTAAGGLAVLARAAALAPAAAQGADATAEAFIERLGGQTVGTLAEKSAPVRERVARLKGVLNQAADLPYIARVILGRSWRQASEEQRAEYLRLFDALVLQTMAERIDSYSGQTFEIAGSRVVDEADTIVSTNIAQPSGGPTYRVNWRVRKQDAGGFRLIDIEAEGVSLVLTQRSEVNDIVGRSGVDGLLAEMRRRLEQRDRLGAPAPA
jgi:phospholipid transport system substrate-binding protein